MSYQHIENSLLSHPDVVEVCALAAPHPITEKSIKAFVVLQQGARVTAEFLESYLKENVNGLSETVSVQVLPELPKSPTGAVSRRALIALC